MVTRMTYLGYYFSRNFLSPTTHVEAIIKKVSLKIAHLSMIKNSVKGLRVDIALRLYTGAICPAITYASPSWWDSTKSAALALSRLENAFLK